MIEAAWLYYVGLVGEGLKYLLIFEEGYCGECLPFKLESSLCLLTLGDM